MRANFLRLLRPCGVVWSCLLLVALLGGCEPSPPARKTASAAAAAAPKPPPLVELVWPTPNPAFSQGRPIEEFVQPTESGLVTSGLFGSTRSAGRKFHEGLDLYPINRDAKGEALDPVGAALAGVVRHVNARPIGGYGRYVVLEHPAQSPPVYTLYAHLAEVTPGLTPGREVEAGQALGRMGRSASGYTIPRERAHLHFEIGLRLADDFDAWYRQRGFGSPNEHGRYNGMNLLGLDPLEFFSRRREGRLPTLDVVFRELPAALTLRVARAGEPAFLRRYPSLVDPSADAAARTAAAGWEIDIGAAGMPLRWRPLSAAELTGWKRDELRIVRTDAALLAANRGRDLVRTVKGVARPDDDLRTMLELTLGWRE
jgi:peptidoglycan LD-endopeptidase LytH